MLHNRELIICYRKYITVRDSAFLGMDLFVGTIILSNTDTQSFAVIARKVS